MQNHSRPILAYLCLQLALLVALFTALSIGDTSGLPNVTHSGYLDVNKEDGSQIFYTYYEAQSKVDKSTPVLLWLQGGPGCAGQFGNLYELGLQLVTRNLSLAENEGAWNRRAGLLFVDQPVGTGFSPSGSGKVPADEAEIAADVYVALLDFFSTFQELQDRPFVITGESYAGKYIPSIGHFILEMERLHGLRPPSRACPEHTGRLPPSAQKLGPPNFKLAGLAIGNGLTDPEAQVQTHAATAFYQGLIDTPQRVAAMGMQLQVQQAISHTDWDRAGDLRGGLLKYLQEAIGCGTMLDSRRTVDYDSEHLVDRYLNQAEVKEHLGAYKNITFEGCSERVDKALAADVMKSVKYLIPDLLDNLPLLLYQGAFDAQDGPASQEAWLHDLVWHGRIGFRDAKRWLWRANSGGGVPHFNGSQVLDGEEGHGGVGRVLGYWKEWDTLSHVIVREAGHMVPRDDPLTAQAMIESWLDRSILSRGKSLNLQQDVTQSFVAVV